MGDDTGGITLSILLDRIRGEVDTLVGLVGDMQTGLSPMLEHIASTDASAYRHAQSLDLVLQTLDNLSLVLGGASRADASDRPIDIDVVAKDVSLSDLAARLRGLADAEHSGGDDLDLF